MRLVTIKSIVKLLHPLQVLEASRLVGLSLMVQNSLCDIAYKTMK